MADSWRQINLLEVKVIELNYVNNGKVNELSVIVSYPIVKAQLHARLDEDLCSAY